MANWLAALDGAIEPASGWFFIVLLVRSSVQETILTAVFSRNQLCSEFFIIEDPLIHAFIGHDLTRTPHQHFETARNLKRILKL